MDKFLIQSNQYQFPYHYIPSLNKKVPHIYRVLKWGMDYLTYMSHIQTTIEQMKPTSILDVGCGDGYMLNNINLNTKKLGIDLEPKAIEFAKLFSNNAEFDNKSIEEIDQQFEMVTLIEVLEHINDEMLPSFIEETFKRIKLNGYLLITVPTTVVPLNKKHFRHYTETILDTQLSIVGLEKIKSVRLYNSKSIITKLINLLLINKLFILNHSRFLSFLWKIHEKYTYYGNEETGLHICALYKKY